MVSDEDFERVSKIRWSFVYVKGCNYAVGNGLLMHRFIMNCKGIIDHKDGNGLNNQRDNLRIVTHTQNMHNSRKNKIGTSRYKGVWFRKELGSWSSQIMHNGKRYQVGTFKDEETAALAYNAKAKELFGEFAYLNNVENKRKENKK